MHAPAAEPPAAKPQSTPNKTLIDRISVESPKDLFNELKERADKVPFDYYALALLSDIVEKSPIGFASWLIQGIAAHRQDGALKQLLHEYFRGIQSAPALLKLLPLAARAIRTDEFYPLTEPAWQVVLHDCSFDQFADAFDRCERELRDSHIVGRMAFLIYMLKSAMWLDDSADGWSARQFRFVEENFASIPPWLEWDVELLGLARAYLAIRDQFAAGSPLRTRMDAALKDYFSESQETGDRAVVAAQMEILASGDRLMDDFPIEQNELLAKFYPIWAWASHDVAERQSIDQDKVAINENIWASRAVALLERLEKQCSASPTGWLWSVALMARMVTLALVALMASTLVVTFLLMASNLLGLDKNGATEFFVPVVVVGGIIGLAVATLYWIKPLLDERIWFPLNGRFAATCYRKLWRRELMDFQRRSHVPDQFFRACSPTLPKRAPPPPG